MRIFCKEYLILWSKVELIIDLKYLMNKLKDDCLLVMIQAFCVRDPPVILKLHNLQSLNKALDFL